MEMPQKLLGVGSCIFCCDFSYKLLFRLRQPLVITHLTSLIPVLCNVIGDLAPISNTVNSCS